MANQANIRISCNREYSMDQSYLQELINEVNARDGGLILNVGGKPEAVVLSIEKYNEIIQKSEIRSASGRTKSETENQIGQTLFNPKTVLVTGGAGYIGAHLAKQLLNAGHLVIVIDNLSTGKRENVPPNAKFIEGDIGDLNLLRDIFASNSVDCVMHLAASIEVEESVANPAKYLENNALNTAKLLSAMAEAKVENIIFSSTAAVYGKQTEQPILETAPLLPNNPYGFSKLLAEEIIKYYCQTLNFKAVVLRYFNACGSDYDGKVRATHESHLLAKLLKVISGETETLVVNGNDYDTHDGSCVRDYVHVLDIAEAHLLALDELERLSGLQIYNVGTGRGVSVLEMVNAAAEILNKMVPMELGPRRPGDAASSVADTGKILRELGFKAKFSDTETIIKTSFRQAQNS